MRGQDLKLAKVHRLSVGQYMSSHEVLHGVDTLTVMYPHETVSSDVVTADKV